ncbi:hypothetical protein KI387_024325, partial [Taxus chinensis]
MVPKTSAEALECLTEAWRPNKALEALNMVIPFLSLSSRMKTLDSGTYLGEENPQARIFGTIEYLKQVAKSLQVISKATIQFSYKTLAITHVLFLSYPFGKNEKVVVLRKRPELRGRPTAVVQYNSWKGGGLIAVGYEAREFGVKRSMRGDEAKKVCSDIQLVQVPVAHGKADLTLYREAGSEVVSVLARKGRCERASIDEVYLDITDAATALLSELSLESIELFSDELLKTHILGFQKETEDRKEMVKRWLCRNDADHRDRMLLCGAIIVAELRMQVLSETQFTCSA